MLRFSKISLDLLGGIKIWGRVGFLYKKSPSWGIANGGEEGIRTPDTVAGIHDFESRAFNQLCHLSTLRTESVTTPILKNSGSCICYVSQIYDLSLG